MHLFLVLILNNNKFTKSIHQIVKFIKNNRIHLKTSKIDLDISYFEPTDIHSKINQENITLYKDVYQNYLEITQTWNKIEQFKSINNDNDHYRLLAAIVKSLDAKKIIEFGTGSGLSAFAMLHNDNVQVLSFDIVHYKKLNWARFEVEQKFIWDQLDNNENFSQEIIKINTEAIRSYEMRKSISDSDLIVIDLDHSGEVERELLNFIQNNKLKIPIYMDDTNLTTLKNLLDRSEFNQYDFTPIGHFSGSKLLVIK